RLELHPVHPDPPPAGGFVQDAAQLSVDLVAAGQSLLQVHRADDVTQRGDGELFNTGDVVGDLIRGRFGVGDLEVDHRVDADDKVVAGDHRLRWEGHDLLSQVDAGTHLVDE